jgi:hypothetical protein
MLKYQATQVGNEIWKEQKNTACVYIFYFF